MTQTRARRYGFDASCRARIGAFLRERHLESGKLRHAQLPIVRCGAFA